MYYSIKHTIVTILLCVGVNVRGADVIQKFFNQQVAHQPFRLPQKAIDDFLLQSVMSNDFVNSEQDIFPQCSICMNSLTEGTLYKLSKVDSSCGHVFHHACLDEWVQDHWICPMDRIEVQGYKSPPLSIATLRERGWNIQVTDDDRINIERGESSLSICSVASLKGLDAVGSIVKLDLSNCGLKIVPDMSSLATLRILSLSYNKGVATIPEGSLPPNLEVLDLIYCGLKKVPVDVRAMAGLRILSLSYNKGVATIPEGSLPPNLEELNLGECNLEKVPDDVRSCIH